MFHIKIEAGFINEEGMRVLTTMSDVKWDFYCLIDRLFHPEKYADKEDVEKSIKRITKRLKDACASRVNRTDVTRFIKECQMCPPEEREETEKEILRQIADTY